MPLMEAMACGLPTIATDWGAHTEFVHEGIAYPLQVRGTIPAVAKCPYYEGFSWADPDPEHLRHLLRHVYENREEARRRGAAAAREMAEKWTWDHSARQDPANASKRWKAEAYAGFGRAVTHREIGRDDAMADQDVFRPAEHLDHRDVLRIGGVEVVHDVSRPADS